MQVIRVWGFEMSHLLLDICAYYKNLGCGNRRQAKRPQLSKPFSKSDRLLQV